MLELSGFGLFMAALIWACAWLLVLVLRYRQIIVACWQEPVLKSPVLIFESDDWGPGAADDAYQLQRIAKLLRQYQDSVGRHPVMTLGLILALPDSSRIKMSDYKSYYRITLSDERFASILDEIKKGVCEGVFTTQLHGMEHYWPSDLMSSLHENDELKLLLDREPLLRTELLPDGLQSRWRQNEKLAADTVSRGEVTRAVEDETDTFNAIFGEKAKVIVPPTFVWHQQVELNWQACGLAYLVTPGFIAKGRDEQGMMLVGGELIYNGLQSVSGLTYLVRNDFFEPSKGHRAEQALLALDEKTRLGRPTLLEIHRFNFCDNEAQSVSSRAQLERCLTGAQKNWPELRFVSTGELGDMYSDPNHPQTLVDRRITNRLLVFMARLWAYRALRKWLCISGLFVVVKTLSVANKWR